MNKKTVALSDDEYTKIIDAISSGFYYKQGDTMHKFRPNHRLSMILQLEAILGVRISDVLNLRLNDIIKDGDRYRLNITEQKTGKKRLFSVPVSVYTAILDYVLKNKIEPDQIIFGINERAVQKQLKIVCDHLGIENVGTHSFRKTFATTIYKSSGMNIELVRQVLQHSNIATTQRYIGICREELESALCLVSDKFLFG